MIYGSINVMAIAMVRPGLERHPGAARADVFCWRAEADVFRTCGTRTAYKNTALARRV